jgi:2-amino-4-hydroxy-6-hydroxymethyldihydropteridine diphosphokinase
MAKVYIALGSNVGDSEKQIEQATSLLAEHLNNIQRTELYRSRAVGYTDQPDFVNTAVSGETTLTPEELLAFTQEIEQQIGRVQRFRWGPREIDIDVIFYDDLVQQTDQLTLPHPEFRKRDFVLKPLSDLNPQLKDPVTGRTVSGLLAELPKTAKSIID